jgi:23S rRNA pseudouridine2605 synthase
MKMKTKEVETPRGAPRRTRARKDAPASAAATEATRERVQKVLARMGLASRRTIEEWIVQGRVAINDRPAQLGDRVGPGDRIKVDGKLLAWRPGHGVPRVLLYHKPEGEIVSREDPQGRPSVFDRLPALRKGRWIAVGRLDFNTSGLLIFTDDGELANRLMHPRYELEREYAVRLIGELTPQQIEELTGGITLEDGPARFESLVDAGGEGANHWYRVTIKEGRNREVRRMFEALGLTVSRLIRVRYGPVALPPRLRRGMWMELPPETVVQTFGLTPPAKASVPAANGKAPRPRATPRPSPTHRSKR